jgi:hypothetical protein
MIKKNKISVEVPRNIDKDLFLKTYMGYIGLSKILFGNIENPIYDITEIPEENEFHLPARKIAESLGIDWKHMTHDESNRIMLALLEDTYMAMLKVAEKEKLLIEVILKILK